MKVTTFEPLRRATLPLALIAAGMLAGCSGGTPESASADVSATPGTSTSSQPATKSEARAPADFEGTMQQLMISLGPDAISSIAGSSDLEAILALSPDRVIEAVNNGEVEAESIQKSTVEIDGPMGRVEYEGQSGYTIIDGEQQAIRVVDGDNRTIMTMRPDEMAAGKNGEESSPVAPDIETLGKREIRGFDTTGYRFEFLDDSIVTIWMSEDLGSQIGAVFDVWTDLSPFGHMEQLGDGVPVRTVTVNHETLAAGGGFMPAYTIVEQYDLQPGDIDDTRFELPEGYQQMDMADLARGMQMPSGE
ncbi:DUF4412 domain-containing protein [Lysobacter sp. A286]